MEKYYKVMAICLMVCGKRISAFADKEINIKIMAMIRTTTTVV